MKCLIIAGNIRRKFNFSEKTKTNHDITIEVSTFDPKEGEWLFDLFGKDETFEVKYLDKNNPLTLKNARVARYRPITGPEGILKVDATIHSNKFETEVWSVS